MHKSLKYSLIVVVGALLSSCAAGPDDTGLEYAPQMYHSTPYEPLTQITEDSFAGTWLDSNEEDGHGEFYNSNPYNPYQMNMRRPVENTIKRGTILQEDFTNEQLELAASSWVSPLDPDDEDVVKGGKVLYDRFCEHCHGEKGAGDGLVAEKYAGVANLNGAAYLNITEGHIVHVITYGKGLMGAHGSQISLEDRWRIARYVKEMQNAN